MEDLFVMGQRKEIRDQHSNENIQWVSKGYNLFFYVFFLVFY